MICHICQREAVGQCKSCGKFYCPEHGDVWCATCAHGVSKAPLSQEQGTSGPGCYICRGPAAGACPKCGKFYCSEHGGRWRLWEGSGKGFCQNCYESLASRYAIQLMIVIPIIVVIVMAVLARGCR